MFHKAWAGILKLTCGLMTAAVCFGVLGAQADQSDLREVIILHTNDLHFDFNYQEAVRAKIDRFRAQYAEVFMLDAGDVSNRPRRWRDGMDADEYERRFRLMIATMNELGYDAMTLGNHDLGYHERVTRDVLRTANFPRLGANVQVETDNYDQPQAFAILETDHGITLAVLGVCGGGYDNAEGISLSSPAATLPEYSHLRDTNNVFILLTHIGDKADRDLAGHFGDMVDVIIGGHSHRSVDPPELVNGVLYTRAGGHAHAINPDRRQHLGALRLQFDAGGLLVDKQGEVLRFDAGGHTRSSFLKPPANGLP